MSHSILPPSKNIAIVLAVFIEFSSASESTLNWLISMISIYLLFGDSNVDAHLIITAV